MTVKMIIATDQNFGIGKDNKLPWDCPEDMQYFKEQTEGYHVVMGFNTFESLPFKRGLPNRDNTVITSWDRKCFLEDGQDYYLEVTLLPKVVGELRLHKKDLDLDTWIIGGASIYKELLPYVEEIHHTTIEGTYDCDTFFDMSFVKEWKLIGGKDLATNAVLKVWRKNDLT